jgi:hypothetical protein
MTNMKVVITDEERVKLRDSMDEETRWKYLCELHKRSMDRFLAGGKTEREITLEARLERIEQRLETLEAKT